MLVRVKAGTATPEEIPPLGVLIADGIRLDVARAAPHRPMSAHFATWMALTIVWKSLRETQRAEVLRARLLSVYGEWQREGDVKNLIAHKLEDLTPLLGQLTTTSRDFH